jgi:hypothetical protein
MRIEKIDSGFLDTNFRFTQVLLENRSNWSSSSEAYREDRFNISIIHDALFAKHCRLRQCVFIEEQ